MPRLKSKIYLDDGISYIDFETNKFRSYDSKGKLKNVSLSVRERVILAYLCHNYNRDVASHEILKKLESNSFDMEKASPITKIISDLREKVSNKSTKKRFIASEGQSSFRILLNDSPFEDDEKGIEQLLAMNEELKFENEKLRNELREQPKASKDSATSRSSLSAAEFFEQAFSATEELGKVFSIDLALLSAWDLVKNRDYMKKFQEALDRNITIRIIVNPSSLRDIASLLEEQMCHYMVALNDYYHDIERSYTDKWAVSLAKLYDMEETNPRLIQVLPAKIPLLHNIYIVKGDTGKGWVRIKYFTYNNFSYIEDPVLFFKNSDAEYKLYCKEFDYIWKFSKNENNTKPEYADVIRYCEDMYSDEPSEEEIEAGRKFIKSIIDMNVFDDSYYDY